MLADLAGSSPIGLAIEVKLLTVWPLTSYLFVAELMQDIGLHSAPIVGCFLICTAMAIETSPLKTALRAVVTVVRKADLLCNRFVWRMIGWHLMATILS